MYSMTRVAATKEEIGVAYVDTRRGYAYCSTCIVKIEKDPADDRRFRRIVGSEPQNAVCDYPGCDKLLSESAETIKGTAMVEIVACKIF